jgi:hypothetical protein
VRELPPGLPVVGELLQEGSLERSRLDRGVRRILEDSTAKWVLNLQ